MYAKLFCAARTTYCQEPIGLKIRADPQNSKDLQTNQSDEQKWMTRMKNVIKELRRDLNRVVAFSKIKNKSHKARRKYEKLKTKYKKEARYECENEGLAGVHDTMKQKLLSKAAKLRAYAKIHQRRID